jgi:hypothetical protein
MYASKSCNKCFVAQANKHTFSHYLQVTCELLLLLLQRNPDVQPSRLLIHDATM